MSSTRLVVAPPTWTPGQPPSPPEPVRVRLWSVYGVLGVLLVAYLLSLILRPAGQHNLFLDGWLVAVFELVAGALCVGAVFGRYRGRLIPAVLGAALLSWAIGDVVLTIESSLGNPQTPSLADLFYLGFYPLMYAAVLLILRRQLTNLLPATWLDGAVAGLGAATVCATFAFHSIVTEIGGSPMTIATDLAYPIGDVLLLGLVVGATAVLPSVRKAQWALLASACALNAIGDTFNLFQSSGATSRLGTVFDGIAWPTAILLISAAAWMRPARFEPLAQQRPPSFFLPGAGACASLVVLFMGTVDHVDRVALALALATLATIGIRLAFSVRGLSSLTEERYRQSVTDELTGLGNRRRLFQLLDSFFSDQAEPFAPSRQLAFLFVDLDRFKEVNDSYGHSAGDELLKQLGPRLTDSLRSSDVLVRLGGDEFGVILMDTDPNYATNVAQRVALKLEDPFTLEAGVTVQISASIGIAVAPRDATDAAGLLRCADVAMYRAKLSRSSFHVYQEQADDTGDRLRLVEELRGAVKDGHFVLHYQPQIDLQRNQVTAVEALLRWPHPRLGLVPPLDFLPLAEEAGLMQHLTRWVLEQALHQCASWWASGRQLAVSVNISATNLLDKGFIQMVQGALLKNDLPPTALILEMTETTIIANLSRCKAVIAELRELGVGVSIDDFGAGFTSLAYLGGLAASELKLDRAFVTGLGNPDRERDLALVRSTIALGHSLGLRVVAEGIEDNQTLDLLIKAGCDLAQGYYISRPMPPADLALDEGQLAAKPRLANTEQAS